MTGNRRENKKLTESYVRELLSRKQFASLLEYQYFGWRLKFIRTSQFKEPVPVLFNTKTDQIGILDPDGHIIMDMEIEVRPYKSKSDQIKQSPQAETAPVSEPWEEKRKDMASVPNNLDAYLNLHQMHILRQIESFGWKLHFVRRSLFQEPLPVILNPDGNKFATLERDGRINLTPGSALRKEEPAKQTGNEAVRVSIKNRRD